MRTLLTYLFALALFLPVANAQQLDLSQFKKMKPRSLGPAGMSGRVTSIDVVLDQPEIIYAGTASGGVWRSKSGGIKWEPIFDDQPVQSIGAVAIQQSNPDVIWVGTGEGNPRNSHSSGKGIYKSIDGGKNWTLMGLEATKTIHRIIIHRDNPDIVFVAAMGSIWGSNEERGVYRTKDGGKTWEKVLYNNNLTGCADLVTDPSNPDKLIAAMWEYHREPWFFTSGGEGSGLYVSFDGGDTWKKRTDEDGLPKGELGRIGLAISHSSPNVIYALVEAKKNGLYRSDDGGFKWRKVADKNIGNRPFYYADIFVDPQNENRLYNLYSVVSMSEDGGKTFKTIMPYWGVHPDHHAWWIHPDDPNFIIDGNDGGINISHDRGRSWRFVENLPVGQFYHISIDNDVPYNIYGGMQDNGSWRGPAYVWQNGGIRNHHWQEVLFGDGFDVIPNAKDNRYGFAMYQGGNVYSFDVETGHGEFIKPLHPHGVPLRFNWNAAIAQNPFHDCGIYFGSQFVHKSMDCGKSWTIISPDLTSNDTTKQKQHESGGLTIDATRAESHTTITAIAPSPKDENVIWAGSDDGYVYVTKDGGQNWENCYARMKGAPKGAWIPQIEVSPHNAGEAYVVVNNYRQNDWSAHVYKTTDYGKKWIRLVDDNKVKGHCHAIVQDPVAPNLLFLGTEFGLWVSIDGGANWTQWTEGYPSCPTIDLKIHPREHDLIIGTFGRAAWVMDNILPLRQLALEGTSLMEKDLVVFDVPDAYLNSSQSAAGVRFHADAHFRGQNKRGGAMISVWLKKKLKKGYKNAKGDKVKPEFVVVDILNQGGDTIRSYKTKIDTGLNRVYWNLRENGYHYPSWSDRKKGADLPSGYMTIPGTYKVHLTYGKQKAETQVTVLADPRINLTADDYRAYQAFMNDSRKLVDAATEAFDRMKEAKKLIGHVNGRLQYADSTWKDSLQNYGKTLTDSLNTLMSLYMLPKDFKGLEHVTERLNSHLSRPSSYVSGVPEEINATAKIALEYAEDEVKKVLVRVNAFFSEQWPDYPKSVKAANIDPFKEYEPIEIKE